MIWIYLWGLVMRFYWLSTWARAVIKSWNSNFVGRFFVSLLSSTAIQTATKIALYTKQKHKTWNSSVVYTDLNQNRDTATQMYTTNNHRAFHRNDEFKEKQHFGTKFSVAQSVLPCHNLSVSFHCYSTTMCFIISFDRISEISWNAI